jgi:hypothetical protein
MWFDECTLRYRRNLISFRKWFTIILADLHDPVSSVSIVTGYALDDRAIKFRFPAEAKEFSFCLCVQTGSGAHPASCTMGTGGPFLGVKNGRGVTLTAYPDLVPRSRMSRSYISSPPSAFMACSGMAKNNKELERSTLLVKDAFQNNLRRLLVRQQQRA